MQRFTVLTLVIAGLLAGCTMLTASSSSKPAVRQETASRYPVRGRTQNFYSRSTVSGKPKTVSSVPRP